MISNKTPLGIIVRKKTTLLESTNNEMEEERKQNQSILAQLDQGTKQPSDIHFTRLFESL